MVHEAHVDGQAPRLIRSQVPDMDWNGSEEEDYRGFGSVLDSANRQLMAHSKPGCD